jgi:hypothetical protein
MWGERKEEPRQNEYCSDEKKSQGVPRADELQDLDQAT